MPEGLARTGRRQPARQSRAVPAALGLLLAALVMSRIEHEIADRARRLRANAASPSGIPAGGWADILRRTCREMAADRVMAVAAGVTFYALLAVFPGITAFVSLYGLFTDPATVSEHLAPLWGVLPDGAVEIIRDQLSRVSSQGATRLGLGFLLSLAIALWSANAGMKALFDALNVVHGEAEKRGFLVLNALSLTFTLGAILAMLVTVGAIVAVPIALDHVGLASSTEALLRLSRWPLLVIGAIAGLALLYRFGPSRRQAKRRWVTPGGVAAAVLWALSSAAFSWYVANFGSYNETYGSLGAAIGFMTWIWISSIVVLAGAELDSEIGPSGIQAAGPMGLRDAAMADGIGVNRR